jgi:hypothetical protein
MRQERRVAIDQRDLTSSCISLFFFCSIRSLPIHAFCLSRHHTPSYNLSLCAAALTITSWVARPPGAHHKQQQAHAILFAQSAHLSVFRLNRTGKPATVFCTHVLRFGRSLPDCPSRAGERLECSFSPWNFDPFSFLMLRCMGLGYCPSIVALAHHLFDLAVILGQ